MVHVEKSLLIGTGTTRDCYTHPDEGEMCIKIAKPGNYKRCKREMKYFECLLKRNISWEMLSEFYGVVETDQGPGFVFCLVRDYTGEVSRTLDDCLMSESEAVDVETLMNAIDDLKKYLFDERIVVRDPKSWNIMYQKTSEEGRKLVIVDGVGNNDAIPLSHYVDYFAQRKIARKWNRFIRHLKRDYKHNPEFQQAIENIYG
jgi:PhoP regulatory network protein YrbL